MIGLFRNLNPIFVFLFTIATRYIFRVASTEEEGGQKLAYMISSPVLNNISGYYYSGKPGSNEFIPTNVSKEAENVKLAQKLWDLTSKLVR